MAEDEQINLYIVIRFIHHHDILSFVSKFGFCCKGLITYPALLNTESSKLSPLSDDFGGKTDR